MPLYFTEPGLNSFQEREKKMVALVRSSGAEVGDAAGMNCDWHDNAGFDEAKRSLEFNSRRLQEIRAALGQALLVTLTEQANSVRIGSTVFVTLTDKNGNDEKKEFTIGAYAETDTKLGLIAYDSPMAAVMIAQEVGATLEAVRMGTKVVDITIDRILPPSAKYTQLISQFYRFAE